MTWQAKKKNTRLNSLFITTSLFYFCSPAHCDELPKIQLNGGLRFESQGAGTPNSLGGYLFAPLATNENGDVFFFDGSLNLNFASSLSDTTVGASTRLGYRWLLPDHDWLLGTSIGFDVSPFQSTYFYQAGVGFEALSRNIEFRLNGYIPFANTNQLTQAGYTSAFLANDNLIVNGFQQYGVSLGSVEAEIGAPVARWDSGDLRLYAAYYNLYGDYTPASSGIRGRAEVRLGESVALGGTVSYDNIFDTRATGYIRLGISPQYREVNSAEIAKEEERFLALRGLPVERERNVRINIATVNSVNAVALNVATNTPLLVRCAAVNPTDSGCLYSNLNQVLSQGSSDVILLGNGTISDLANQTVRLPIAVSLSDSLRAPTVLTQFGPVNLATVFRSGAGTAPTIKNGVLSIGSNTSIQGLSFENTSITNYSTKNVIVARNKFIGSFTDNPTALAIAQANGPINVSPNALPVIQLEGVTNLVISGNEFIYPQVQTFLSQKGKNDKTGGQEFVCNQNNINTSGLCLSANAIRLNNTNQVDIAFNTVVGALDEAFRINNPSGLLRIRGNDISQMRTGPDSNIGTAIIIGQNKGSSIVQITDNLISNNSTGIYSKVEAATGTVLPAASGKNSIDPIELGLCRGDESFPRFQDLYASSDFSGNCSSPSIIDLTVARNTINLPDLPKPFKQDGDGIDFNIGANGVLKSTVADNNILSLGDPKKNIGDNGLTFDIRGNSQVSLNILNNFIQNSGDAAIGFSLQNTSISGSSGAALIQISGNRFGSDVSKSVNAEIVPNTGIPVSSFSVNGEGDNALLPGNVTEQRFNNQGPFPRLILNGSPFSK